MADEKISAMPAATGTNDADLIPIVQGGVNMAAARAALLTSLPGGTMQLNFQGMAASGYDNLGSFIGTPIPGQQISFSDATGNYGFQIDEIFGLSLGSTGPLFTSGIQLDTSQNIIFTVATGSSFRLTDGVTNFIANDLVGSFTIQSVAGQIMTVSNITGSGFIQYGDGTAAIFAAPGMNFTIGYNPHTPANWHVPAPADVWNALDRIAAAVAGLLGGPIP